MPDQITNEDLYGTSGSPSQSEPAKPAEPLVYEEIPEVPLTPSVEPAPVVHPKKPSSCLKNIGIVILLIALFVGGIWLSTVIRDYIPNNVVQMIQPKTTAGLTPTPTILSGIPSLPYADWISYDIISGLTKKPVAGVSFKLPPDVLSPICDGTGCMSQGTYLPGGTRFTVAARGSGQALNDYRGSTITDVSGTAFVTTQSTMSGRLATEFRGSFAGKTIAGYAFSRMRGVMVAVTSTLSLEFNHFTPSGTTTDFEKDDALFDQILETLTIAPIAIPIATSTPKPATSSGY